MIRVDQLKLSLDDDEAVLPLLAAGMLRVSPSAIEGWRIHKKAVDARRKQDVHFVYSVDVSLRGDEGKVLSRCKNGRARAVRETTLTFPACDPPDAPPLVVGFGPAGMFAALTLARMGLRPLVIERGRPADERYQAVQRFWLLGQLQPDNNVQFGEGGAGTFSDGKLTTGTKSPYIPYILREMASCGGGGDILTDARPHIGTDRLVKMVGELRRRIEKLGGKVLFSHQLTGFVIRDGVLRAVEATTPEGREEIACSCCILALGHSARDTFEMLQQQGIALAPKAFAMGVRIEHAQEFIDAAQYGPFAGHPALPPADYKLAVHLPNGHTAYTFCMCPGGQVVAAASEEGGVVTNGMSFSRRDGVNANSALLISLAPEDLPASDTPLAGMYWQRELEQSFFRAGGGTYEAPAQLAADFLAGRPSAAAREVMPSYRPGVRYGDIYGLLPAMLGDSLRDGLRRMDKIIGGFCGGGAVLTGPETRSSSPVRILRDEYCQTAVEGLFCCGEGAGYAGGIMSSAADGMRCAFAAARLLY